MRVIYFVLLCISSCSASTVQIYIFAGTFLYCLREKKCTIQEFQNEETCFLFCYSYT